MKAVARNESAKNRRRLDRAHLHLLYLREIRHLVISLTALLTVVTGLIILLRR